MSLPYSFLGPLSYMFFRNGPKALYLHVGCDVDLLHLVTACNLKPSPDHMEHSTAATSIFLTFEAFRHKILYKSLVFGQIT